MQNDNLFNEFSAYTITEISKIFKISRSKIYLEIKAGKLHPKKIGSRTIVLSSEITRWLNQL